MISVEFLREAEVELLETIVHYEEITIGLGLDFYREVNGAVGHIEAFPNAWTLNDDGTRRYLLNRFPYIVIYCMHNDRIWILGVSACRQRPRNWKFLIQKTKQNQ